MAEQRLNHGRGTQLRTEEGPILDVYNSGKVVLGGKQQELLRPVTFEESNRRSESTDPGNDRLIQLEAENRRLQSSLSHREFVIEVMTECLEETRQRRIDDDWESRRKARRWR
jgi:hypothetical protein